MQERGKAQTQFRTPVDRMLVFRISFVLIAFVHFCIPALPTFSRPPSVPTAC